MKRRDKRREIQVLIRQLCETHNIVKFTIDEFQDQYRINGVQLTTLIAFTSNGKQIDSDNLNMDLRAEIAEYFRYAIRDSGEVLGRDLLELFPEEIELYDNSGERITDESFLHAEENSDS